MSVQDAPAHIRRVQKARGMMAMTLQVMVAAPPVEDASVAALAGSVGAVADGM